MYVVQVLSTAFKASTGMVSKLMLSQVGLAFKLLHCTVQSIKYLT